MRRYVLMLFAGCALSLAAAGPALGCVCVLSPNALTPEEARAALVKDFNEAFAVFTGEAVEGDTFTVKFKVDKLWKGSVGDRIVMPTGAKKYEDGTYSVNSCDYSFRVGERYLVFAYGDSAGKMQAHACTRTKPLSRAGAEVEQLDTVGPHERKNRKPPAERPGAQGRR